MDHTKIKLDLLIHDLKAPLAIIEAGVEALIKYPDKYGPLSPLQHKVLRRIRRNSKAARHRVNDILEIGRSRKGIIYREKIPLAAVIGQTLVEINDLMDMTHCQKLKQGLPLRDLQEILQELSISLEVDAEDWYRVFYLDAPKTVQIMRNLLSNAIKYRKRQVILAVTSDLQGKMLTFSVRDDGAGIPKDFHQKIFEEYFQMDPEGSFPVRGHGIGLAGVLVLVEELAGQLLLESDSGQGANFIVHLPVQAPP
jgi:signal transduction histidine kinase